MREDGGTAIELPKFRDAGGVWRAAITLPEEVHSPIAKAVFDELVERGLAVRRLGAMTAISPARVDEMKKSHNIVIWKITGILQRWQTTTRPP